MVNSVHHANPDQISPYLLRTSIVDNRHVKALFSEPMDSTSISGSEGWQVRGTEVIIDSVTWIPPDFGTLLLKLSTEIAPGHVYQLVPPVDIRDCAQNVIDTTLHVQFAIPDSIAPFDIVINEILPDPYTGGERFIEIYNRSDKIMDLKNLVILNPADSSDPVSISNDGFLFFPGDFLALTSDPGNIILHYRVPFLDRIWKMERMPGMNDESGTLVIARKNDLTEIDRIDYSKEMQFPLLTSFQGVSLERINPSGSSLSKGNWHSAAESSGFATPGYRNSEVVPEGIDGHEIQLIPEIFSPDNDGKDDILFINFHLDRPGFMANIAIYDDRGRVVRNLVRNEMVAPETGFSWDGITDQNRKAPIGIYIVKIDFFNPDGTVKAFKKVAVVAGRY